MHIERKYIFLDQSPDGLVDKWMNRQIQKDKGKVKGKLLESKEGSNINHDKSFWCNVALGEVRWRLRILNSDPIASNVLTPAPNIIDLTSSSSWKNIAWHNYRDGNIVIHTLICREVHIHCHPLFDMQRSTVNVQAQVQGKKHDMANTPWHIYCHPLSNPSAERNSDMLHVCIWVLDHLYF